MTGINIRNEPIKYKIENIKFSNENKEKIINLLKKMNQMHLVKII